jgi:hypothetical protein
MRKVKVFPICAILITIPFLLCLNASFAPAQEVFVEDFESGGIGWSSDNGVWEIGTPTAGPAECHSGSQCAGTILDGSYPFDIASRFISPPVTLPDVSSGESIHLRLWQWFSYAQGDAGHLQISVFDDTTYQWSIWTSIGNTILNSSPDWALWEIDLTGYSSKEVKLAFYHTADGAAESFGWYVDDIEIVFSCVEGVLRSCGSDEGECRSGTQTCANGKWGSCEGEIGPTEEICDGLDNDCDGDADNDFDIGADCTVGQGICEAEGVMVCLEDGSGAECDAIPYNAGTEICEDYLDNDCDGDTDEEACNHNPDCSGASPSISHIWPPNHKMVNIQITGVTDYDGDSTAITVTGITQDEPVNDTGDGNTFPDANGIETDNAQVRAERSGEGDGRVYEIFFTADDGRDGECSGSVSVCVPHDKGKGNECIDNGQDFSSLGRYGFNVLIDLNKYPVEVCFIPDQPLNNDPIVTYAAGDGTLRTVDQTIIPPGDGFAVSPVDDSCPDRPAYCVYYSPDDDDSEVEIRIDEDPDNPVFPGFLGSGVAVFEIDKDHETATSFCIYNKSGGSGCLRDNPCNTDYESGVFVEFDPDDLDMSEGEGKICIPVKIAEVDPDSIPPIPNIGITGISDITLPDGVVIGKGRTLTIIFSFELPTGWSRQEFADSLLVLYYDEDTNSWKSDGISDINIHWDTPTSGTIAFKTNHLTPFAASAKKDTASSTAGADSGGGCSINAAGRNMPVGSALANTILIFLPLLILGILTRIVQ